MAQIKTKIKITNFNWKNIENTELSLKLWPQQRIQKYKKTHYYILVGEEFFFCFSLRFSLVHFLYTFTAANDVILTKFL